MTNVAEDPSYSDTLNTLSATLFEVLEKHNDPRVTERECRFDYSPYAGPVLTDWNDNPHNDQIWFPPVTD